MIPCFFASDLHGRLTRYAALLRAIESERPRAVFLGGDLLPGGAATDFIAGFLSGELDRLRARLGDRYPTVFAILGNDDGRPAEADMLEAAARGLWVYVHGRATQLPPFTVYGYTYVPPTPFLLKDWERFDVSRYVDPGCVPPTEGRHSDPGAREEAKAATITDDLRRLTGDADVGHAVFLFHAPPYRTCLDRAALDDRAVDHAPLDVHVGSIAIRRFIEERQPWLTLHGHIHESARLTGSWRDRIGRTPLISAAHDGDELALVRFDLENPAGAERVLLR